YLRHYTRTSPHTVSFTAAPTTAIYPLSLHDALPIWATGNLDQLPLKFSASDSACSTSLALTLVGLSARRWRLRSAWSARPVPAGLRRPTTTFSFRPRRWSRLPVAAASVSTRVVSWKEAAEMKDSVDSDALVIPSSTRSYLAGNLSWATRASFSSSTWVSST